MKYVYFDIPSIICELFESQFHEELKQWVPSKKGQIDFLNKLFQEFKLTKWSNVDARAMIEWEQNGVITHYCFDRLGYFYDGKKVYTNKRLFNFLKKHLSIN